MIAATTVLDELIAGCRSAADPIHDLLIAGEGNASVTTEDGDFLVTASGARLGELTRDDLVEVDRDAVLAGLRRELDDAAWRDVITRASLGARVPTVEVGLHAVVSATSGPGVILHTHPTDVLTMMVEGRGAELAETRLFPDHVVMCGPSSMYLPYIDPGFVLAQRLEAMGDSLPSVIHLGNHGVVARAYDARSALDVTLMVAKSARILRRVAGTVVALDSANIQRIFEREDEKLRQHVLGLHRPTE